MMRQYRIEAYDNTHGGRVRVSYATAARPSDAIIKFRQGFPERVMRAMWQLVPPMYWEPEMPEETDPNNHLEDSQP